MGVFPRAAVDPPATVESSPRSWGCFYPQVTLNRYRLVFPTLVGVFPFWMQTIFCLFCLPHARGGVSSFFQVVPSPSLSSPRSWGCFQQQPTNHHHHESLPHARGGVSTRIVSSIRAPRSSPRSWGCFIDDSTRPPSLGGLPHARGGVSIWEASPV